MAGQSVPVVAAMASHLARETAALSLPRHTGIVDTPPARKPKIDYTAPVGSIDLADFDEADEPYEIRACHYCLPWHAEVHIADDGRVFVREWHAVDCEEFRGLLSTAKDQL